MRAYIFAFVVAGTTPAFAQELVDLPFSPATPSTFVVESVQARTSNNPQRPSRAGRTRATLELRRGSTGFEAIWTTVSIEAGGHTMTSSTPGAAALFVGVPLTLKLDQAGAPQTVVDWEGLRARIFAVLQSATPEAERTSDWHRANETVERMFASMDPATAAQTIFPDISILSICQETSLRVGETQSFEGETPSVFGGSPIPTVAQYELQAIDRTAGVATIIYDSSLEPEAAAASFRMAMERIARETGRDPAAGQPEFAGGTLAHTTRAECSVDLATGVTRSVTHTVTAVFGGDSSTDRRVITLTPQR